MLFDLLEKIQQADEFAIEDLLKAVLRRHAILFPDVELHIISLQKTSDRNEQIGRVLELLENMKTFS